MVLVDGARSWENVAVRVLMRIPFRKRLVAGGNEAVDGQRLVLRRFSCRLLCVEASGKRSGAGHPRRRDGSRCGSGKGSRRVGRWRLP